MNGMPFEDTSAPYIFDFMHGGRTNSWDWSDIGIFLGP